MLRCGIPQIWGQPAGAGWCIVPDWVKFQASSIEFKTKIFPYLKDKLKQYSQKINTPFYQRKEIKRCLHGNAFVFFPSSGFNSRHSLLGGEEPLKGLRYRDGMHLACVGDVAKPHQCVTTSSYFTFLNTTTCLDRPSAQTQNKTCSAALPERWHEMQAAPVPGGCGVWLGKVAQCIKVEG